MTRRPRARRFALGALVVGALCAAAPLPAQALPPVTRAKQAAARAAAAASAHTNAMSSPSAVEGAAASRDSAGRPRAGTAPAAQPGAPGRPGAQQLAQAAPGGRPARDSTAATVVSVRGGKNEVALEREVYSYDREGRRDPFRSLLASGDLRPMFQDLRLVAVVYDPAGRSVAVMRDMSSKDQYRVRVGQVLGRMRVTQIHPKSVTFTIEEFGFSRQEVLALQKDPTKARTQ